MTNGNSFFKYMSKSDIVKIIVITTLYFVIIQSIRITLLMNDEPITFYNEKVWYRLGLTSTFTSWISHAWSIITYMFAEDNFLQVIGNMIWLWVFGSVIEDLKGPNRILPIYLVGGFVAGIIYVVLGTIFKPTQINFYAGAMPCIMSIAVATVIYKPHYEFWHLFGRAIPIWVFGAIYFILQLVTIGEYNLQNISLLLGAILVGIFYNYGLSTFFDFLTEKFNRFGNYFTNNENFIEKKNNQNRPLIYNKSTQSALKIETSNIDILLDKINNNGINSLTEKEKKDLEKFSKQ